MLEARQIAELLNQLFAIDPAAAADLVNHRVVCNDAFLGSDIPFVCSQSRDGVITMGMVGFVNAMAKPELVTQQPCMTMMGNLPASQW